MCEFSRYEGKLAERMPGLFVVLPNTMLRAHPTIARSLASNQHILTTFFDVHVTLKHLLALLTAPSADPGAATYTTPYGKGASLLEPLPSARTCTEAAIPDFHCLCAQSTPIPDPSLHPAVLAGTAAALHRINAILDHPAVVAAGCQRQSLFAVESAYQSAVDPAVNTFTGLDAKNDWRPAFGKPTWDASQPNMLTLLLRTTPGDSLYEVELKLKHSVTQQKKWQVVGLQRVTSYAADVATCKGGNPPPQLIVLDGRKQRVRVEVSCTCRLDSIAIGGSSSSPSPAV